MEPHAELEEGEECYCKDDHVDDTSIDPDIALSYIDEKLQSVLGHFQKDFEGEVSAENLGARYGGYGSFLPMYQCPPSLLSQPKTSQRFHNQSTSLAMENSMGVPYSPPSQRNGVTGSCNVHSLHSLRGTSRDGLDRKELCLPSAQIAENSSAKDELSLNKSLNSVDQKALKVRIKVGSDKKAERNAVIYSGLGLTSPSSTGSSPVEIGEIYSEFQKIPDESPSSIFLMMTSFPVAGGHLLSPLHDHLLALSINGNHLEDSNNVAAQKDGHDKSSISVDSSTSRLRDGDDLKTEKVKSVWNSKNFMQSKRRSKIDTRGDAIPCLKKNLGSETLENWQCLSNDLNGKVQSNSVYDAGESLKVVCVVPEPVRQPKRDVKVKKRDLSKGRMKDLKLASNLINDESSGQTRGKSQHPEAKNSSAEKIGELQNKGFQKDNKKLGRSKDSKTPTTVESNSDISVSKNDCKGAVGQLKEKLNIKAANCHQDGLRTVDRKKKSAEGTDKSTGVYGKSMLDLAKERAGASATKNKKSAWKDVQERTSGHKSKESKLEAHTEQQANCYSKSRQKCSHTKVAAADEIISNTEPTPQGEVVQARLLIEDNWVQCDKCEKWRLLPQDMNPDHLPLSWTCSMLNWLPGMNHCDVSEGETTEALNALYAPLSENQNKLQNHIVGGVISVLDVNGNDHNVSYDNLATQGKKNHKARASGNDGPSLTTTFTKTTQGKMVKGDEMTKKKTKRESHLSECRDVNKIKSDGGQASGMGLEADGATNGLPIKAAVMDIRRHMGYGYQKKTKSDIRPRFSVDKQDHMQHSLDSGSLDIKACDGKELSTKKRNFNDQDYMETLQSNVGSLGDNNAILKVDADDSVFRKHKKSKITNTEPNESSTSKGKKKAKAKGAVTRTTLTGSRSSPIDKSIQKDQLRKKYTLKICSKLTVNDVDSLRKDLGCEQLSTAAVSSSSNISDSHRSRAKLQVKGTPIESVSSFPKRTLNLNKISSTRIKSFEKVDAKAGDFLLMGSPKNQMDRKMNWEKGKWSRVHPEAFDSRVLNFWDSEAMEKSDTGVRHSDIGNGHSGNSNISMLEEHIHVASSNDRKDSISKDHFSSLSHPQRSGKSFPLKAKDKNKAFNTSIHQVGEVSDPQSDNKGLKIKQKLKEETKVNHSHIEYGDKSTRNGQDIDNDTAKSGDGIRDTQLKCEGDHGYTKFGASCYTGGRASKKQRLSLEFDAVTSARDGSTPMKSKEERSQVGARCGDKLESFVGPIKHLLNFYEGAFVDLNSADASIGVSLTNMSKDLDSVICEKGAQKSVSHLAPDLSAISDLGGPSLYKRNASNMSATSALKEAEELRDYADCLKRTGFDFEYNEAYFQTALKFLHGASLLETCSAESNKYREMNEMQIYSNTAKLCENCANEYEKRKEMAAAALAYKCMEVAYMRVVYCKYMSTSKAWHDMQSYLQIPLLPQGESPSSSASDLDNANSQAMVERIALPSVNYSQPGNHVIAPQHHPNFVQLIDFTKIVNAAMEASGKVQNAFAAANAILKEAENKDAILSVKRAIDFSFQDVEELIRLVRLAMEAISRQSFSGSR